MKAQIYEHYDYEVLFYVDNLRVQLIPDCFHEAYYNSLTKKDYRAFRTTDDNRKKTMVHLYSKKANDGFRYVNKCIMDYLESMDCKLDGMKAAYVLDDNTVMTENEVMSFLRLREKNIYVSKVSRDDSSGIVSVFVYSNSGRY